MEKFVRQKVAVGEYETASEVVREALRLLRPQTPGLNRRTRAFWPVRGQYVNVYEREMAPLKIVRIRHGARDVSSELQ
jgi:Arc/MetJ-type ribon-helix-helix transcriptional regulator